jgi:hypothetical protein
MADKSDSRPVAVVIGPIDLDPRPIEELEALIKELEALIEAKEKRRRRFLDAYPRMLSLPSACLRPDLPIPGEVPIWALSMVKQYRERESSIAALKTTVDQLKTTVDHKQRAARVAAEGGSAGVDRTGATRRGYKAEVRAYMERSQISTIADAARRLGVGYDTLKSIMSSKGKPRYSKETLQNVLQKIRLLDQS